MPRGMGGCLKQARARLSRTLTSEHPSMSSLDHPIQRKVDCGHFVLNEATRHLKERPRDPLGGFCNIQIAMLQGWP